MSFDTVQCSDDGILKTLEIVAVGDQSSTDLYRSERTGFSETLIGSFGLLMADCMKKSPAIVPDFFVWNVRRI